MSGYETPDLTKKEPKAKAKTKSPEFSY